MSSWDLVRPTSQRWKMEPATRTEECEMSPRVVSAAEWLAARKELQAAEEEAMRALEQIAGRRRELPAVAVEKDYVFEGPDGRASLLDLFQGRTQLIVQHFMFDRPGTLAARSARIRPTTSVTWLTCIRTTPRTRRYPGRRSAR